MLKITDAVKAVGRVGLSCIGYGNDPRYQPDVREPVNNVGATNFIELIDGSVWPGLEYLEYLEYFSVDCT